VTRTDWNSNGDWIEQSSQFGQWGNFAYALDTFYNSAVGQHRNGDLEQLALSAQMKLQLNPSDDVFVRTLTLI